MQISVRFRAVSALLSIVFIISTPLAVSAESTTDINTQIQNLSGQLQSLLQQVRALTPTATTSSGQTAADIDALSAKLDALKQQIKTMIESIKANLPNQGSFPSWNASSTTPHMERGCRTFTRSFSHGSEGDDVRSLQEILSENDLLDSDSHTGFFGPKTAEALAKFQERFMGVASSSRGSFGPMTREFIHRHCANIPQAGNATSTWNRPDPVNWKLPSTTWPTWNYPTTTWHIKWNASSTAGERLTIPAVRLERGMNGEQVHRLQEVLASRNDGVFTDENVTGFFGPKTEEALKRFQESFNIEPIGFAGPQTIQKINEIIDNAVSEGFNAGTEQLQTVIDRVHEIQQQIPTLTSSTSTFDISRLKELLGEIKTLHQQIPAAAQDIISDTNSGTGNSSLWRCVPRPACLDATPRCMLPEPVAGWCSTNPPTPSGDTMVACTMDAKMCPDGTYVGRTGPHCSFVCPQTAPTPDQNPFGGTKPTIPAIPPIPPIPTIPVTIPTVGGSGSSSCTSASGQTFANGQVHVSSGECSTALSGGVMCPVKYQICLNGQWR